MRTKLFVFLIMMACTISSLLAEVTWLTDLDGAKRSSKLMKKPILLWVGIHSHRTRPMILTEKPFDELAKKILCVNLNPLEMTEKQKEDYEVDSSNFSRFYYYDIEFNLLGFEDNPPKSVITYVNNMIKSVEAKEEEKKEEKKEEVVEDGAKALWEKANRFELDEKFDSQITMLKQIVAKFPTSSYAELAKLKIDKIQNDPALKTIMESQKKEDTAMRNLKSVDSLIKNNKKDLAIKKLESIISDFPDTKAAIEAKVLLEKLNKE